MNIDDLIHTSGAWLQAEGPMADVVVSSRIRLARNVADFPFLSTASASERIEIYRCLCDAITNTNAGREATLIEIHELDPLDREILVERHLVSRQHIAGTGMRGVSVSPGEDQALMINEEDHLRIQALGSGLQLDALWAQVDKIDDELSERVSFAYDEQYGFLTACPTNVGTGIRVSVMLHLPALKFTNEIEKVARAARDMRLAVRGTQGEGTDALGDFYQVSNQTTLGKSETELIRAFSDTIIPKIVEFERTARESLVNHSLPQLDDKIWRAYGVLAHARTITSDESQDLLSPLRMGIHLGRFPLLNIAELNDLFLSVQPAHLQKKVGKELSGEQRDVARADLLRKRFARSG